VISSVREHPITIVVAPPGAGKTTGLPLPLIESEWFNQRQLWLAQPRRLAARAAAARLAQLHHQSLGRDVGYQVRFERTGTRDTRLWVMTNGILLRRLQLDPVLEDVALVILDEFHERSLEVDLALGMLRRIQQTIRPDLRVLIMSATLDGRAIGQALGNAPVIESSGRSFPVDVQYLLPRQRNELDEAIHRAVSAAISQTDGNILVFLPGVGEIQRVLRSLNTAIPRGIGLMPLFGDLSAEQQEHVLAPSDHRKIVLATNVAETSVTIPGVTAVIDSGLARVMITDPNRGLPRLELQRISQASADQRAGRAGRTSPGRCWRLWSSAEPREPVTRPEIERGDLTSTVLQLAGWGEYELAQFPWLTPPPPSAVETARRTLRQLGALDETGITPLGQRLLSIPSHPRIAKLLLAGVELGISDAACLAAALLTERDPFRVVGAGNGRPPTRTQHRTKCDLADRVQVLLGDTEAARHVPEPHPGAVRNVRKVADQFQRLLTENGGSVAEVRPLEEQLAKALLAALPDRVAKLRQIGSPRGRMVGGRGVVIGPPSGIQDTDLFLCVDLDDTGTDATVRSAAALQFEWLDPHLVETAEEVFFHPTQLQVVARARTYYLDLLIDEQPIARGSPEANAQLLTQEAIARWPQAFPQDDSGLEQLVERIRCLAAWCPELNLPALDESALQQWTASLAFGRRSFAELREAPWGDVILSQLNDLQRRSLEQFTPARITLPNGRTAAIRYAAGKPPVLAARIQDLFGWKATPRIAGGKVPLTLHLLGPNQRPQQVTDDLASFWQNTYPQVRKDLRRRYPKHAWPEDPCAKHD
jgi:ATP-dependent helicase HrpB